MRLPKPGENGTYEMPPAGTYTARCYRFLDLGTQITEFNGERKTRHEVMISWELSDELMSDGRPFTASKSYTWSMHEKATLRRDLEAWRGKSFVDADFEGADAFDTRKLLNAPCTLTITHETKGDKTYAKVSSIGKLMKGVTPTPVVNQLVYLALTREDFDAAVYGALSDRIKEKIASSPEYKDIMQIRRMSDDPGPARHGDLDDDIPF